MQSEISINNRSDYTFTQPLLQIRAGVKVCVYFMCTLPLVLLSVLMDDIVIGLSQVQNNSNAFTIKTWYIETLE